jgi:polysaccharide deacetylase 2 family uncharacterized protein YibQ
MKFALPKPDFGALAAKAKSLASPEALRARLPKALGGAGGPDAHGVAAAPDPYADVPEHLRPTFFDRNAHVLPVYGAYALFALLLLGVGIYLALNAEAIEAERKARIPQVTVTEFERVDMRSETAEVEAEAPPSGAEPSESEPAETAAVPAVEGEAPPPRSADAPDPYAGNLAPYPDPALVEEVERLGQLPIIGADGREPWKVYARPSSSLENRPRIAVVVLNLGLSVETTEAAIALPGPVTLAFSPYAPRLDEWIAEARAAGHEVMIGLPMEPRDFPRSDAGLLSLRTTEPEEENMQNLHRVMSAAGGYIGLVNFLGSGFTANRAAVRPVMEDLANRGLVYFDTLENATSVAPEEAERAGTPHATADLVVDQGLSRSALLAQLSRVELLAKNRETAVVAVRPYPMLLNRMRDWTRGLAGKDLVLTPLSGVITARIRGS